MFLNENSNELDYVLFGVNTVIQFTYCTTQKYIYLFYNTVIQFIYSTVEYILCNTVVQFHM